MAANKTMDLPTDIDSTAGSGLVSTALFGVVYADPPWRYDHARDNRKIENHYDTMGVDEIAAMEIPSDKNCVCYMWATAPKLKEALYVLEKWGFEYKTQAVWSKGVKGMGYWFRGMHEILLVGVKGKVSPPPPELRIGSVIECYAGSTQARNGANKCEAHSRKPDEVRARIQEWFPDVPKLEMFSRLKRPGWEVFGNQVEYDLLSGEFPPPNSVIS